MQSTAPDTFDAYSQVDRHPKDFDMTNSANKVVQMTTDENIQRARK